MLLAYHAWRDGSTRSSSRWCGSSSRSAGCSNGRPPPAPPRAPPVQGAHGLRTFVMAMAASPLIAIGDPRPGRRRRAGAPCRWPLPFLAPVARGAGRRLSRSAARSRRRAWLSAADDRAVPASGRAEDLALLRDASSARRTTGCRPTTTRRRRTAASRTARRRPTSGWGCSRRWRRTTSASSTPSELVERLERTLDTIEGLERHEGHLLNWYDTRHARAAVAALRLDRRQRQPRRGADRARAGAARGRRRGTTTQAALRAGLRRHRRACCARSLPALARAATPPRRRCLRAGRGRRRGAAASWRGTREPDVDGGVRRGAGSARSSRLLERVRRPLRPGTSSRRDAAAVERCAQLRAALASGCRADRDRCRRMPAPTWRAGAARSPTACNFAFLYDRDAPALRHRLPARRRGRPGPARALVLRPAGLRGAPGELRRDREGRRAAGALVPLGRLVVSVDGVPTLLSWSATMFEYLMPLAPDADATRARCSTRPAARRCGARSTTAAARRALGHLGVGLQPRRSPRATISTRRSACPGSGSSAGSPTTSWSRRTRPRWRCHGRSRRGGGEPASASPRAGAEGRSATTRRSTTRRARPTRPTSASAERARPHGVVVHVLPGAPPGHDPGRARERAARRRDGGALPRRSARPGDRAAAPGARAARASADPSRGRPRRRARAPVAPTSPLRRFRSPHTLYPHAQFLSNGAYITVVTNAGGGASRGAGCSVTRWREDRTRDPGSQFIYLRDVRSGRGLVRDLPADRAASPRNTWSSSSTERAVFRRRDDEIETQLEIAVSAEDDVEVRRLSLTNRATARARSRSRATSRSCSDVRPTTWRTRPSASCSSRPSTCRAAPRCSAAAGRAPRRSPAPGPLHVLSVEDARRRRSSGRPTARVPRPRPRPRRSDRARRAGALRHHRRGARSGR